MSRVCIGCQRNLPQSSYTANQYSQPYGHSRCVTCDATSQFSSSPGAGQSESGRYNRSAEATFDLDALENPFASGAFRWVAKGRYTSGTRAGEACVGKWFKTGAMFEQDFFTLDIKAVDKALELVDRFNDQGSIDKKIKLNVPGVWRFTSPDCERYNQRVLVEPFIQNYKKFNSNSGWTAEGLGWVQAMQALSHFSYHVSGGGYVLCDLQGGIYQEEVVLSDPVILSRNQEFGITDLGPAGISSFFSYHKCNGYCRPNWTKPSNPVRHFEAVPGSSMIKRTVPTAYSRPAVTRFLGSVGE